MRKNLLQNNGFPSSVHVAEWLKPVENASVDSWYVKAEFIAEGKQYGFTWHEGITCIPSATDPQTLVKAVTAESLFMDVENDLFISNEITAPISNLNGVDRDRMHVFSQWGELHGDEKTMRLDLIVGENEVHVDLEYNNEVLLNGVTGLIEFGSHSSYEYSFPNMRMNGWFKIQGREYEIQDAYAWFDRQVGLINQKMEPQLLQPGKSNWLWIGMPCLCGEKCTISLWDVYNPGQRNAFATIVFEDGTERNVNCEIKYGGIWKSEKTGYSYPRNIMIRIPEEDVEITMDCMTSGTNQEFARNPKELSGCQCLYHATGHFKSYAIDRAANVEMVGDICGEDESL